MADPTGRVAALGALFLGDIKPTGLRPDARLQQQLREFCESNVGAHPPGFVEWLAPHEKRPLWQLAVVSIALNQGIVMMTKGHAHDAEMLHCELELGRALVPSVAPAPGAPAASAAAAGAPEAIIADAAQSPYEFEATTAEDAATSFEKELQGLSLTKCAGRCK